MRYTKLIIILAIILFLGGCKNKHHVSKPYIQNIAFPIELNHGDTKINISNYISEDIRIIKAKADKNIICNILADSINIILKAKGTIKPLSNLHLKSNKGKIDILLKFLKNKNRNKKAPHIYGEKLTDNELSFTVENNYKELFIYFNNKLLDNKNIKKNKEVYTIRIPKSKQKTKNATLRIYAYHNINGISNEFAVPVVKGIFLKSSEEIEHLNYRVSPNEINYEDQQYMQLYKEALRTFVYYKNNSAYLDSLVHKDIYKYGLYRNLNQNLSRKYYNLDYSILSKLNIQIAQILVKYKKLRHYKRAINNINQLNAFLMTIPGPPSYYIKPNISENRPSAMEFSFTKLEDLRRNNIPLIYGSYETVKKDNLTYAYVRKYFKQFCIVVFNKSKFIKKKKINLHASFTDAKAKALFNSKFDISMGKLLIEMQPHSVEIIYGNILK